jgi:hypothetical protein
MHEDIIIIYGRERKEVTYRRPEALLPPPLVFAAPGLSLWSKIDLPHVLKTCTISYGDAGCFLNDILLNLEQSSKVVNNEPKED